MALNRTTKESTTNPYTYIFGVILRFPVKFNIGHVSGQILRRAFGLFFSQKYSKLQQAKREGLK